MRTQASRLLLTLCLVSVVAACSDDDGRSRDAGGGDSGRPDAADVGVIDGGETDGGASDAGADGAIGDASVDASADGGPSDGGVPATVRGGVDLDGDGRADLVAVPRGYIDIYGDPLAASPTRLTVPADPPNPNFGASAALLRDVDGDGLGDLAVHDQADGEVFVYLGAEAGIDPVPVTVLPGCAGCRAEYVVPAGDVNGDGLSDLIVQQDDAFLYGSATLYVGVRTGLARADAWTNRRILGAGDVDGDGDFDLYALDDTLNVLSNDGAMGFEETRVPLPAGAFSSLRAWVGGGDYNGDGFADIALVYADTLYLVPGGAAGPGTPVAIDMPPERGSYGDESVSFGDYDGDGFDDVFMLRATFSRLGARFDFVFGGPTPSAPMTFEDPMPDDLPASFATAYLGDVDGDGRGDFAYSTESADVLVLFGAERGAPLRTLPMGLRISGGGASALGRAL